jgi:hypothetical protein
MASNYDLNRRHFGKTIKENKLGNETQQIMEFQLIKSVINDSDDDSDDDNDDDIDPIFKMMGLINYETNTISLPPPVKYKEYRKEDGSHFGVDDFTRSKLYSWRRYDSCGSKKVSM